MRKAEVLEIIDYWRQPLRLLDWKIDVKMTSVKEIKALATISQDREKRRALMSMARDGDTATPEPYNLEQVVLHELLHLWFQSPNTIEHQGIDAVAWALMEQRHGR